MSEFYILEGKKAVPASDIQEWAKRIDWNNRHVALTEIGDVHISTVFLGVNHNWHSKREPLLFETLVFGGILDGEMERYSTWEEAEKGHQKMVNRVENME